LLSARVVEWAGVRVSGLVGAWNDG
jgi:hypothetical protein